MKSGGVDYRIGPGMSSLLMIFVVLCMAALAVLTLMSVQADSSLNLKSQENTVLYYEATAQAQRELFALDERLAAARAEARGDQAAYASFVQALQAELTVAFPPVGTDEEDEDDALDGGLAMDDEGATEDGLAMDDEGATEDGLAMDDEGATEDGLAMDDEGATEDDFDMDDEAAMDDEGAMEDGAASDDGLTMEDDEPAPPDTDMFAAQADEDALILRFTAPINEDRQLEVLLQVPGTLTGSRYALTSHRVINTKPWEGAENIGQYQKPE